MPTVRSAARAVRQGSKSERRARGAERGRAQQRATRNVHTRHVSSPRTGARALSRAELVRVRWSKSRADRTGGGHQALQRESTAPRDVSSSGARRSRMRRPLRTRALRRRDDRAPSARRPFDFVVQSRPVPAYGRDAPRNRASDATTHPRARRAIAVFQLNAVADLDGVRRQGKRRRRSERPLGGAERRADADVRLWLARGLHSDAAARLSSRRGAFA